MDPLRAVGLAVSVAALGASFAGGYKVGTRKVDEVQAQLDEVRRTEQAVKDADAEYRKKVEQQLAAQAAEHEQRLAALRQQSDADKAQLKAAMDRSQQNAQALRAQAGAAAARVTALQKELAAATTPEQRAALQRQIDAATTTQTTALRAAGGEECLNLPVPPAVLEALNRSVAP